MRSTLLLFFLFASLYLTAQQLYERPLYDYIWLFNNSRMDFNYDPVLVEVDDQPYIQRATSSTA